MLQYSFYKYQELNLDQLYDILALRQNIFVVEQICPYQDIDNNDHIAYHHLVYENKKIIAYARILPKGILYDDYVSIGRVLCTKKYRKKGIGKVLMEKSISHCKQIFPNTAIKISAQIYLAKFYKDLGFIATGDYYNEDNIPHMAMILQ